MYHVRTRYKVLAIFALLVAPIVLLFVVEVINYKIGDPLYHSSYMHLQYEVVQHPQCSNGSCNTKIMMTNRNHKQYHLDFAGVDGPGFAERGTWGAYLIGKKGERCEAYPQDEAYGKFLNPDDSIILELTSECSMDAGEISKADIFDNNVYFE